jgi:hypothetical protein
MPASLMLPGHRCNCWVTSISQNLSWMPANFLRVRVRTGLTAMLRTRLPGKNADVTGWR